MGQTPDDGSGSVAGICLFQVRIKHSNPHVRQYVAIHGWGLLGGLQRVARKMRMPLPFRAAA